VGWWTGVYPRRMRSAMSNSRLAAALRAAALVHHDVAIRAVARLNFCRHLRGVLRNPACLPEFCRWECTFPNGKRPHEDFPGRVQSGGDSAKPPKGTSSPASLPSRMIRLGRRSGDGLALRRLQMAYLDVSPMIIALRTSPSDFEIK